jgi:hypothetical protein
MINAQTVKRELQERATEFGVTFNGEAFDYAVTKYGLEPVRFTVWAILNRYQHEAYKAELAADLGREGR